MMNITGNARKLIEAYEKAFESGLKTSGKSKEEFELETFSNVEEACGFCCYYSRDPHTYWQGYREGSGLSESDDRLVNLILQNIHKQDFDIEMLKKAHTAVETSSEYTVPHYVCACGFRTDVARQPLSVRAKDGGTVKVCPSCNQPALRKALTYTPEMKMQDRLWLDEEEDLNVMEKLYHQITEEARRHGFDGKVDIYCTNNEMIATVFLREDGEIKEEEEHSGFGHCLPLIECLESCLFDTAVVERALDASEDCAPCDAGFLHNESTADTTFEIIDRNGVISDGFRDLKEAVDHLENVLDQSEDFTQKGDLKIVEVHMIRA